MRPQSSRPGKHGPEPRPLAERFWEKVDRRGPDECWPWLAARYAGKGYGAFRVGPKQRRAHVVALELTLGRPLLPGKRGCHACDNPPCCNPAHLWEGTDAENHADRNRKGRQASGVRNGAYTKPESRVYGTRNGRYTKPERTARGDRNGARTHARKLSAEAAQEIRDLHGKELQKETAKRYGIARSTVTKVQNGYIWGSH